MAKKNAPVEQDNLGFDSVEQTLTNTEQFLQNNAKQIGVVVGIMVAIVLGFFAYNNYVLAPKSAEAGRLYSTLKSVSPIL